MSKKAEMGVGTLIVFIAMLLVAAVAAGVLIQTASALQEKSLSTGQQARQQIATNARVIEVSASDGRNQNLTDFQQILKLSPGSYPIKIGQIIFTFNTKDSTSTLKYKGEDGVCLKNNTIGYNTWNPEYIDLHVGTNVNNFTLDEDYDDDGQDDYMYHNDTHILINLSSQPSTVYNVSMGCNLDITGPASDVNCSLDKTGFGNSTHTYGYVELSGRCTTNHTILANMTFVVTPYNLGMGYFVAIYEQTGTNHVAGNLQRGDIVKFCYEAPQAVVEDETVRLNFIPKIGTPTLTEFVSPDVIATQRVYLYP